MRGLVYLIVFAFVIAAPDALAQPKRPVPADRSEAIKKRIRALRAYTLTEELKLDEKTAARLFPALSKWDGITDKLLAQRVELTRQLAASDSIKDPKALDNLIDEALANQKAFWELEEQRLAELRKILTPGQIAKLLIVLPTFERRIQNQLHKAIRNHNVRDDGDDSVEADDRAGTPAPTKRPATGRAAPNP